MAFELSFAPEFFIGPHDLEVETSELHEEGRPTSVFQAIMAMDDDEWETLANDIFKVEMQYLEVDMVLERIREIDTCSTLSSPVEVWIDREGWFRLKVFDGNDA
jgi:hypothetical protein